VTTAPPTRKVPKHAVSLRGPWGAVAIALSCTMTAAVMLGTDRAGLPRILAIGAGLFVGFLSVAALPSVPTRLAVVAVLAMGGFVTARHARLAGAEGLLVLAWVIGAVVTLLLTERAEHLERPRLGDSPPAGSFARVAVGALVAILVVATVIAPAIDRSLHRDVRSGSPSDDWSDPVSAQQLKFTDSLDMRSRPRLSDRVVMTVEADRPAFWRGETFDNWNGTTWTRIPDEHATPLRPQPDGHQLMPAPVDDPGASSGRMNRQTFTIEVGSAQQMFAAPTVSSVLSDREVFGFSDGTIALRPGDELGKGATYTVASQEANATETTLRASATRTAPDWIVARYAQPATTTDRVRQLARQITAGARTPYDKVLAIEAWLGAHTQYSLDAPLPPTETTDVVDYFVFQSHQGWCEQIASTLTVMLRQVGVPARLATGFVTGDRDVVTGRYTVRERDAHAWTEVYFPGVGWQGFDPTADVPLAGEAQRTQSLWEAVTSHALLLIVLAAIAGALFLAWPFLARRVRARAPRREPAWDARTWAALVAVGREVGHPPAPSDTPRRYGRALARVTGVEDLEGVGELVDAAAFGRTPPNEQQVERVERALELARSGAPPDD
jgi:transglutaminase-like putative cysteine protease